jgi:hypothetical protein
MAYITLSYRDFGPSLEKLNSELESVGLRESIGTLVFLHYNAQRAEKASGTRQEIASWALHDGEQGERVVDALLRSGLITEVSATEFHIEGIERQLKSLTRSKKANQWRPSNTLRTTSPPAAPGVRGDGEPLKGSACVIVPDSDSSDGGPLVEGEEKTGDAPEPSALTKIEIRKKKRSVKKKTTTPETVTEAVLPEFDADPKATQQKTRRPATKKKPVGKERALKALAIKSPTPGILVWQSYYDAYLLRYRVEPLRNARINAMCTMLAGLVGNEVAPRLAAYYVESRHWLYAEAKHPMNLLVRDAQKLHTEMLSGKVTTRRAAQREETYNENDAAIAEYLRDEEKKKGGNDAPF